MNYYERPEVSNSFLIAFDRSPAHAFRETRKDSEAMARGRMVHEYILEHEKFHHDYLIVPKIDKRTKEYKELVLKHPDKIIISDDDVSELVGMRDIVNNSIFDGMLLQNVIESSEKEKEVFFDYNGTPAKAKLDMLYQEYIFDLKTCEDARDFLHSVKTYKYYRQAAFYLKAMYELTGIKHRFIFICVEKNDPYGVMIYELSDDWILHGTIENDNAIAKYQAWNGNKKQNYPSLLHVLEMPEYMKRG